jgi:hypothetical protein
MTVIGGKNLTDKQLARLFKRELQATGHQCPQCGAGYAHIEDNGETGRALAFVCTSCDWQWDAADITKK